MGLFHATPMSGSLKNPNELREAFIYNEMCTKSHSTIKKFVNSEAAKIMMNEGMISSEVLEKLAHDCDGGHCDKKEMEMTVCHMAKENDDPIWNELVRRRMQEQELLNALFNKYGEAAADKIDIYHKEFIEKGLPSEFRDAE